MRSLKGSDNDRNTDGTPLVSGFVFDTGRFPTGVDPLSELLSKPADLISLSIQTFDSDRDSSDDVSLQSGWNGPYFQLAGVTEIKDGWGFDYSVQDAATWVLTSTGSDGDSNAPEIGFADDLTVSIVKADCNSTVTFRLFEIDGMSGTRIDPTPSGTEKLGVLFYGVNANGAVDGSVEEQLLLVPFPTNSVADQTINFEHQRSSTLGGTIAARAILWDDTDGDDVLDNGETITLKSFVFYASILPDLPRRIEA